MTMNEMVKNAIIHIQSLKLLSSKIKIPVSPVKINQQKY